MLPIRLRLTFIYGGLLFLALVLSGAAVVTLLRLRLTARMDAALDHRLRGVENFLLRETTAATAHMIPQELEEYASTQPEGHLIEVADESGKVLLRPEQVAVPLRSRERSFSLYGHSYRTRASAAVEPIEESVQEVAVLFLWSSPLLLILIGLTGYWISSRSLRPVDEMTHAARSISGSNLSGRLSVPPVKDEIGRLGEAWNEMLGRLEESFERMQRFTADAAHELRTPLAALRTTAELALRRQRDSEEYRHALEQVVKISERLEHLTGALLSVARGEHPPAPQIIGRVNLAALIRGVATELEPLFAEKGIHFGATLPERPAYVQGEAEGLRRLVGALLDNALKYTKRGGDVNLRLEETRDGLDLEITDTGCGIPQDSLHRVFDRFYRVDSSRDRETGGYGLGLSIAQQIARSHLGRLEVSSVLNEGSSFRLHLPKNGLHSS